MMVLVNSSLMSIVLSTCLLKLDFFKFLLCIFLFIFLLCIFHDQMFSSSDLNANAKAVLIN